MLALSALAMVSCQKELLSPAVQEGQEVAVSIDLTTPLMGTKAYGDGNTVNKVRVHVYQQDESGTTLKYIEPAASEATVKTPSQTVDMRNGTASYSTRLVTGQKYTFVFWAENSSCSAYTYTPGNQTVTVSYANAAGNDESRDAFYAVLKDVEITGAYSARVPLHRPFAQINFGASDYDAAKAAGIEVTGAAVKLTNVANSLNLLTGDVTGNETVTFENAAISTIPNGTLTAANGTYKYVAMDYVLVGKDRKTLSDVTLTLDVTGTTSTTPKYTYTSVPLQGNFRTNIVGNLFTSPADIQIEVVPGFNNPDENVVVENVSNITAANTAFASGATSVNVTEITSSDPDAIILPATTSEVSLTLPAAPADKNITIKYADDATVYPAALNITAVNAESLTIVAPKTHVEVNGVTVTSLTASTSNNTLVVGSDVKVTTLTIEAGAVEIYGEVGTLTKGTNAGDVKVWAVGDKATFSKAYSAGAQTIELKNDIKDFESVIEIGRNLNLDGNGFAIHNTANRVVRITKPNLTVNFTDVALISKCTAGSDVRCVSFDNIASGANVLFDNCELSASFYCINAVPGPENLNVTLRNATVASGWAAINCFANNSTFTVENSTLKGLNDKGESSWNDYATIVFDGNGLETNSSAGVNGSGNTLNITNSVIYASSESSNNQAWLALQYGAKRNRVEVDAATQIIDASGTDQTSNIVVGSTENSKVGNDYNPESVILIGGSLVYTSYAASIGSNYYVTLAEALAAVQAGETVQILKSGEYTLETLKGANYTLEAVVEDVVLKHTSKYGSDIAKCDGTVTVKNLTWDVGVALYQYFKNVDAENCIIKGCLFGHTKVNFKSCEFVVESSEDYNIWTYSADIVFDDCKFNCAGKSVLVYKENGTSPYKVTLNNCVFNASQSVEGKAAIEIDSSLNPYEVYINKCTQTGFANGSVSNNPLWNNKKGDSTNLKVVVGGVQQTL